MKPEQLIGLEHSIGTTVDKSITASAVGSGGVDVLSTPSMILLFEQAARDAVLSSLPEGTATVGVKVNIEHLSATPVGEMVRAHAVVTGVDGKKIIFEVTAFDEHGIIGKGTHTRFVINLDRFMSKLLVREQD